MITVGQIFDYLCTFCPPDTACDFDNVGLLVGDGKTALKKALITLDCDKTAAEKAIKEGFDLIITHHPIIWDGLKSVTADNMIFGLIRAGVSAISMHTNLDIAAGGVNDCLCTALGLRNVETHIAADGFALRCGTANGCLPDTFAATIKKHLGGSVKYVVGHTPINRVLVCSGSGGSYLSEAINGEFDALVTSDVKHNVFIDAISAGISLFDAGHYETEKVVCIPLCKKLCENFPTVSFTVFNHELIKSI